MSGRQRAAWIHYRRLEYEMMMLTPAIYRTWHRKNGEEDEETEQEEESEAEEEFADNSGMALVELPGACENDDAQTGVLGQGTVNSFLPCHVFF